MCTGWKARLTVGSDVLRAQTLARRSACDGASGCCLCHDVRTATLARGQQYLSACGDRDWEWRVPAPAWLRGRGDRRKDRCVRRMSGIGSRHTSISGRMTDCCGAQCPGFIGFGGSDVQVQARQLTYSLPLNLRSYNVLLLDCECVTGVAALQAINVQCLLAPTMLLLFWLDGVSEANTHVMAWLWSLVCADPAQRRCV